MVLQEKLKLKLKCGSCQGGIMEVEDVRQREEHLYYWGISYIIELLYKKSDQESLTEFFCYKANGNSMKDCF